MKKIIFRKPFISEENRNYGTLCYDKAQFWMNTSRFTEETDVKSYCVETAGIYYDKAQFWMNTSKFAYEEDVKLLSIQMADMYYDKARRALGFISVEDMNRYYEKYRRF